jgi:hypothetical protein
MGLMFLHRKHNLSYAGRMKLHPWYPIHLINRTFNNIKLFFLHLTCICYHILCVRNEK